jgi:DNA replication protein DnaC
MNEQTLDKLKKMKFYGMHRAFKMSLESGKEENFTADEMLAHVTDAEWDDRHHRSIEQKILNARFRYHASVEELIYSSERNLEKNQMMRIIDCSFIRNQNHVLITGSTGSGKSYIASALGYQACCLGYRVIYYNTAKLFAKLKLAKADGSYLKELGKLERQQLLILDDFGIQPLDAQNRAALMEIVEDRHGKSSIIIVSQVPVNKWYDIIGEQTIADAILDRIIHDAHRIELSGESLRKSKNIKKETINN